jgi:hypothetical protein
MIRAFQNFLAGQVHRQEATLTGASPPVANHPALSGENAGQKIAQGHAAAGGGLGVRRKTGYRHRNTHAQTARCGKRIALHVVDKQGKITIVISAANVFVGRIALAVEAIEKALQISHSLRHKILH